MRLGCPCRQSAEQGLRWALSCLLAQMGVLRALSLVEVVVSQLEPGIA